ncbi:MAG: pyrroline-5-carboxylate reductase [Comamonadaceae bacterium]|nr:MAG: pyrroline-5-carboxylate reductase [Comamonadaceae bacterium]
MDKHIAFIGGGNMASAIIGGLVAQGFALSHLHVVEPFDAARTKLHDAFGINAHAKAGDFLTSADLVVWAVKPQTFKDAALQVQSFTRNALHLSVAAGIRSDTIAQWLHTHRVIRSMPNTPALIGKGITALVARDGVSLADKDWASAVIQTTGDVIWLNDETQIDAVTALSGSGPAYMFYFMEAMREAGIGMGLDATQAYQLAVATFIGAGKLAKASSEPPEVLRQRVTSKGGTTNAALSAMEHSGIKASFIQAMQAAQVRAKELGDEFGAV